MDIDHLHHTIVAVCPIVGISIGEPDDRETWRIDFAPGATKQQKAAAKAVLDGFDPAAPTLAEQRSASFKADTGRADLLDRLRAATPAQIDAYVDGNVTDLASARAMFKRVLKLIALDAR